MSKIIVAETEKRKTITTIGTFDGVHIGHQKIVKDIVALGKQKGLVSTVLTLFPHPRMVLQKDSSIKLLNTIEERVARLKAIGVEQVVVKTFTKAFSQLTAEEYVQQILVDELNARVVVVGYDHHFGKDRSGTIDDLRYFGAEHQFEVREIKAQQIADVSVSSTKIRKALSLGDIATANSYLGYAYSLTGTVQPGNKIGRTLNYRTANIKVNADYKLIPKHGVYVVSSSIDEQAVYGMMNIGRNPTIPEKEPSTEVHFFDFEADLYGRELTIHILHHLRNEMKFPDKEALKAQLKQDEQASRSFLNQMK
jgi:riboflavin kinase/FMN adenylyltransferase